MKAHAEGPLSPQKIARIIAEKVPFNREVGFEFEFHEDGRPVLKFDMKPELVGNFTRGNLHGGVISAAIDVIGGFAAFCAMLDRVDLTEVDPEDVFAGLGTIDLRVDYLRAGYGRSFRGEASVLRVGSRIAATRMELYNDSGEMFAAGAGTYVVGIARPDRK